MQNAEQVEMVAKTEQVQMVAKTEQTQMVAKPASSKMVKLFVLREFNVDEAQKDEETGEMIKVSRVVKPGEVVSVSALKAKGLLKKIEGAYSFSGERYNTDGDVKRHDLTMARLATQRDLIPNEPLDTLEDV